LARIDPLVAHPTHLTKHEFNWLVDFVRNGLLDDGADARHLRRLVPKRAPSGRPVLTFEFPDEERCLLELSTGQKMRRNLLYDIKRSEQMASLSDQNDDVELWP
jgi:hypothetical protein